MNIHVFLAVLASLFIFTACTPDNDQPAAPSNTVPTANAGADQDVTEGQTVTLNGAGSSDSDGSIVSYFWQPTDNAVTFSNPNQATVTFTVPPVTTTTNFTFSLTVTDNDGASDTDIVVVTIKNSENTLSAQIIDGGQTAEEGNLVTMTGNATDGDGTIENHQWEQIDCNDPGTTLSDITLTTDSENPAKVTFTAPEVANATDFCFRYTATDDEGNTASDTNKITVTNKNTPPMAVATNDATGAVSPSTTVNLIGSSSSDADGPIANYKWELIGAPDTTLTDGAASDITYTVPASATNSTISFRLTVTDGQGVTDSAITTITVLADPSSPSAFIDNTEFTVDEFVDLELLGRAAGGSGGYSYSWAQIGGSDATLLNATEANAIFSGLEVHRDTEYTFELTVTDSDTKTATAQITITVKNILEARNRYQHNNQCFVMYNIGTTRYVQDDTGYKANQDEPQDALKFFLKPASLGHYVIYNEAGEVLSNTGNELGVTFGLTALNDATAETAVFKFIGQGDADTTYPPLPGGIHVEPTKIEIDEYRDFNEPKFEATAFKLTLGSDTLSVGADSSLSLGAASGTDQDFFNFETTDCGDPESGGLIFPEATSNTSGGSYAGTIPAPDGYEKPMVIGHVDAHVHISSTNFLGKAQWGFPFDPLGVTHALGSCTPFHGEEGERDAVGTAFALNPDNPNTFDPRHNTDGWPTFPDWPARGSLLHEAIYWGWLERAWKGGLRVIVNDLVDNETLCELNRSVTAGTDASAAAQDCNAMNNIGRQVGSMYAMQDYIDAQYGGRGEGFYQIVLDPDEAREEITKGNAAVVLGIEISNFLDCKVTYNPSRLEEPYQETGAGGNENTWGCTMAETGEDPKEVKAQLERLWNLGVRQIIGIHEFDNALGGNGIFDDLVLNLGNRENSGGIPVGGVNVAGSLLGANDSDPFQGSSDVPVEQGSGEFWTTYECPQVQDADHVGKNARGEIGLQESLNNPDIFSGYYNGQGSTELENDETVGGEPKKVRVDVGGTVMRGLPEDTGFTCYSSPIPGSPQTFTGQGGRPGGTLPCYPQTRQCNARLMTPIGLYTYSLLMEMGFIFDIDHMAVGMKTQALMLAEAQTPPYPMVSTHGSFGGTTNDQAVRMYRNGGHIFPSLGGASSFKNWVKQAKKIWELAADSPYRVGVFGLGYGTDTNGLSGQAGARGQAQKDARPVVYPFELYADHESFGEGVLNNFFNGTNTVSFEQPSVYDYSQSLGRDWHIDTDGSAQYGLLADFVEELNLEANQNHANPASDHQDYQDALEALFSSAESYLRTWENTVKSSDAIKARHADFESNGGGFRNAAEGLYGTRVLRPAAKPIDSVDLSPPGGSNPAELNNPVENHFDSWGTEHDPYIPARP